MKYCRNIYHYESKCRTQETGHNCDSAHLELWPFFSSSERSPGRAFALIPASASTFMLTFLKSLYFPDHLIKLVHIWYDVDIVSKFYSAIPNQLLQGQGHDLELFNVNVF